MYITKCVVLMLPRLQKCQGIKEGAHEDSIDAKVNGMLKGVLLPENLRAHLQLSV